MRPRGSEGLGDWAEVAQPWAMKERQFPLGSPLAGPPSTPQGLVLDNTQYRAL